MPVHTPVCGTRGRRTSPSALLGDGAKRARSAAASAQKMPTATAGGMASKSSICAA